MRTINYIICFVFIVTFFWSCAPAYTPNMVNTPLLSSKGEFQATIGTGTSGIDPQFAYAITDHVGIMANASFANRSDSSNFHKHSFAEVGGGYTLLLGDAGRFEVYGGAGMGNVDAMYNEDIFTGRSNAVFTRIFVQPSIGAVTSAFDGAFTPRLVFVNINHSNSTLNTNTFDPFFEPTLTTKFGWKYVKMIIQVGLSFPLTEYKNYTNQPFMFSIGLAGKIPGKKQSKTKS